MSIAPEPQSLAAWAQALDRIEASVQQALALAAELPPLPPPAGMEAAVSGQFRRLEDRLAGLRDRLNAAEQIAADADGRLEAETRAFQDWQGTLAVVQVKLAALTPRAVT